MKASKFSEEQIAYALRQAESGTAMADVCCQIGLSEATFYVWKTRFAHLGVSELRRMRQLADENGRLKGLVADLTLDQRMLSEALRKKGRGRRAAARSSTGAAPRSGSASCAPPPRSSTTRSAR